jgi:hypothetical protein
LPAFALPNLVGGTGTGGAGVSGARTAYGTVPNPIANPASTYSESTQVSPGLPALTNSATSAIQSQLSGQVSPETVKFLQDQAAAYGVGAGVGGGFGGQNFNTNNLLTKLGMTSEGLVQQGVQNYNQFLPTLASTQLSPELQAEIASQNAIWAAAPDPALAARQQISDMESLYNWEQRKNPATGTGALETSMLPGTTGYQRFIGSLGPGTTQTAPGVFHTPYAAGA